MIFLILFQANIYFLHNSSKFLIHLSLKNYHTFTMHDALHLKARFNSILELVGDLQQKRSWWKWSLRSLGLKYNQFRSHVQDISYPSFKYLQRWRNSQITHGYLHWGFFSPISCTVVTSHCFFLHSPSLTLVLPYHYRVVWQQLTSVYHGTLVGEDLFLQICPLSCDILE